MLPGGTSDYYSLGTARKWHWNSLVVGGAEPGGGIVGAILGGGFGAAGGAGIALAISMVGHQPNCTSTSASPSCSDDCSRIDELREYPQRSKPDRTQRRAGVNNANFENITSINAVFGSGTAAGTINVNATPEPSSIIPFGSEYLLCWRSASQKESGEWALFSSTLRYGD